MRGDGVCLPGPHLKVFLFTHSNELSCWNVQLLSRVAKVFKDYCGTLSEESIRKNFILLYELLDEMIDYGYPQVTQTENLKAFVYNEPIVVEAIAHTGGLVNPKTASASAVYVFVLFILVLISRGRVCFDFFHFLGVIYAIYSF